MNVFSLLPVCAAISLAGLGSGAFAQAAEQRSTLADQREVAVTIYNDNLALVKDQRRIALPPGASNLAFRDVSARMRAETALLRSVSQPGAVRVVEQNFDFDLLSPQKLLEKYVGQTVSVVRTHPTTGAETVESAKVLAANGGVVLQVGNRIETGVPGRIVYGEVPANLRDRPTLVMALENAQPQAQDIELSYLTGGLSWRADYVVELGAKDDMLDISGWVTLTNTSGATYRNARLQLVAGDVNRVQQEMQAAPRALAMAAPAMAKVANDMAEEGLFEYHLYTLARPTTIAENQTKQVALMSANGVPVRKEMVLRGSDYYYQSQAGEIGKKLKVGVFVEFENREAARLGLPLPKGVVRVYKKDKAGNAQFIGEDRIDHTPKNEKVRLKLGEAFDVTADKRQTDFRQVSNDNRKGYAFDTAYEIVLKNAKDEAVQVTVQEPIPGDWQMTASSQPHTKAAANLATWTVNVPAQGSTKLTYRVLTRF
ncbi:DUF4139 domain-containing protein [Curvibacter sp. APW13]|uniref:DUF4139 domain-containing protein n=1 Tax=Curvibacter sp. APW13 TaxID=3077236 RepID=UPI0028DDDB57|nr:DUF4139 domain-containing protein [Curvibacter sp. APW13]MDT8991202.1 DUF4139 domain-containing protein [Curvibacter sp. APW13]